MGLEAFLINPMGRNKPKRKVKTKTRTKARTTTKKRSSPKKKRTRTNPLAGVGKLMLVGGNPRMATTNRPKRKKRTAKRRSTGGYSMALRGNAPQKPRRRVRRSSTTVRKVRYYNAPKKRRRGRKMRRNPANPMLRLPRISLKRPASFIMPIGVGVAAYMATDKLPTMVMPLATPNTRTMLQLGITIGGGLAMVPLVGNVGAIAWLAASGAATLGSIVNRWLASMTTPTTTDTTTTTQGLGYVPYPALPGGGYDLNLGGVGAFPQEAMW